MNDAESIIRANKAKLKIDHDYQLAERIGITKQSMSRKIKKPWTFTWFEIGELANIFKWSDSELGEFVRSIYDRRD